MNPTIQRRTRKKTQRSRYLLTPKEVEILKSMTIKPIEEMRYAHKHLFLAVHGAEWEVAAKILFPSR
jgi:hypothetical protein